MRLVDGGEFGSITFLLFRDGRVEVLEDKIGYCQGRVDPASLVVGPELFSIVIQVEQ